MTNHTSTSESAGRDWQRELAVDGARDWMDGAIQSIESDLSELRRFRERFLEVTAKGAAPDTLATSVNVVSWFTSRLAQTGANARIDLAPNKAAALALTER
jgi:hypothetical protein